MTIINIKAIRLDGGTQTREQTNQYTVAEYAAAMTGGAEFPPITVFHDGADYWLADGYHTTLATQRVGRASIEANVNSGGQREALLYALGANVAHGLRRTNADKRKAVITALEHEEFGKWSDNQIAKACGVSHTFVQNLRASILQPLQDAPTTRTVQRNGKTYEQNTSNIGKREPKDLTNDPGHLCISREEAKARAAEDSRFVPPPEDGAPSDEELDAEQASIAAALQAAHDRLEVIIQSDDKLAAAADEIKRLHVEVGTLKMARDGFMGEANALKKIIKQRDSQIKAMYREIDELKKAAV